MRALHLHSGNLFGGVETLLLAIARNYRLHPEMEHEFALCFDGRLMKDLKTSNAVVHALGEVRISRPASVWKARRQLREILNLRSPDVAISHSPWSHSLFAHEVRSAGKPLVFWVHDAPHGTHWTERWARRTPPDLAICNSYFTTQLAPKLWPGVRLETYYSLVEGPLNDGFKQQRAATRKEMGSSDNSIVIIQACRMEAWKGHLLHLEALSRLKDTPGWECWMVGGAQRPKEASYLGELDRTASRYGIADRVRFLGQRADVPRLLAAADLHCQPNIGPEPFGIAFIEAMYAQLPIVTTAIGAASEIIDSTCGVLVRPNDPGALAAALRALIIDPTKRSALAAGGATRARQLCDPFRQIQRLASLLRTAKTLETAL